jgi:hypothetical protein
VAKKQNPNGFAADPWQYPPFYGLFGYQPQSSEHYLPADPRKP